MHTCQFSANFISIPSDPRPPCPQGPAQHVQGLKGVPRHAPRPRYRPSPLAQRAGSRARPAAASEGHERAPAGVPYLRHELPGERDACPLVSAADTTRSFAGAAARSMHASALARASVPNARKRSEHGRGHRYPPAAHTIWPDSWNTRTSRRTPSSETSFLPAA